MSDHGMTGERLLRGGIAAVLRLGTLVAMLLVGGGLAWALASSEPPPERRAVVEVIFEGGADALIGIGLLGLTLVPIAVAGVAAAGLWRSGERRLARVTVGVLALLGASLVTAAIIGSVPVSR